MDTESVGPWTRSLQSKQTSCLQGEDWWQNPSQWDYHGTTGLNRIAEPPSPVTYLYKGASGIIRMADKYHTSVSDKHGLQCHRPLQYSFTAVRVKDTFNVCVCDSKIMNLRVKDTFIMCVIQESWTGNACLRTKTGDHNTWLYSAQNYTQLKAPPKVELKVNGSKQPWPLQLDVCVLGFLLAYLSVILLNSIISLHGVSLNYCAEKYF